MGLKEEHQYRQRIIRLLGEVRRLLERWCEREYVRLEGKTCQIWPDLTYQWDINQIGGFYVIKEGFCRQRSTRPYESDGDLDDFGCAFRELSESDQGFIIMAHFSNLTEWQNFIKEQNLRPKEGGRKLKVAWLQLLKKCQKRGLV